MNFRRPLMTTVAMLLSMACVMSAQSLYDDDLYGDPSKAPVKTKPAKAKTTYSDAPVIVTTTDGDVYMKGPNGFTYIGQGTVTTTQTTSIDDYNRRGFFAVPDDDVYIPADSVATDGDFTYTRRIEAFHNPTIVTGSEDPELEQLYYSSPATVTINVNTPGYWNPFWGYSYAPVWNSWAPGYWGYYPSWGWNYGWHSWWGPSWAWNWGWTPGWDYGWSWGWSHPVRPPRPTHRPDPGVRPGIGSQHRPGGTLRPGNTIGRPDGTTRYPGGPGRPSVRPGGGTYRPGGTARPGSTVNTPVNGTVTRPSGNYRPGGSNSRPSNSTARPSNNSRPSNNYTPSYNSGSHSQRSGGSYSRPAGGGSRGGGGGRGGRR